MPAQARSAHRSPDLVPAVRRLRPRLGDGASTTVYVAAFPLAEARVRVVRLERYESLVHWCRGAGVPHAIVGGFFMRQGDAALGELRIGGQVVDHVPFDAPWGALRACVHAGPEGIAIARRPDLPAAPPGDLLQAGPLLVRDGAAALDGDDEEGFRAGAHQFDADLSAGRNPRCALALTATHLLALACDGRHDDDAGLTLEELADVLLGLGAHAALNLDGGGSASLVCHGRLLNRPREDHGWDLLDGRPIATALVLGTA